MTKLNWPLTVVAFGCWIVFLPLFSIVHEYGHAYACTSMGGEAEVHMSILGNYTTCLGDNVESGMYRFAGGFFAASIALLTYAILKNKLKGVSKGIAIALVTIGITQVYNMTLETYFNDFYMTGNFNTAINSFMALILLFVMIQRNSKPTIRAVRYNPKDQSKYSADIPDNIFKRSIVDIIKGRKPLPKTYTPTKPANASLPTLDILKGDNED